MTHLEILDLVAGLIFVYFLLSLLCNSVFEGISAIQGIRGKMLEEWIKKTFMEHADHFLNNSLLDGMSEKGKASSYMKATDFSTALIDLIAKKAGMVPKTLDDIETALNSFNTKDGQAFPEDIKRSLLIYVAKAKMVVAKTENEIELKNIQFHNFTTQIENWFDSMMERVSGSYKRKSMQWTFIIAVAATLSVNVDTISIARYLHANKDANAKLAEAAYKAVNDSNYQKKVDAIRTGDKKDSLRIEKKIEVKIIKDSTGKVDTIKEVRIDTIHGLTAKNKKDVVTVDTVIMKVKSDITEISAINDQLNGYLPLGWRKSEYLFFEKNNKCCCNFLTLMLFILYKIPGWLMTIFAVMLGAPFWYDMLGKVANLRNSLKPKPEPNKK